MATNKHKTKMRILGALIILGVFLISLPALGFPARIDNVLIFLSGAALTVTVIFLRRNEREYAETKEVEEGASI